ncbi:hypothetical protein ACEPAH_1773 [Sanghuangporus vaninii]
MLLVQQPQHLPSAALMPLSKQFNTSPSHRRNPSAPAAVIQGQVHPTNRPGLLSISKPAPTRQPRHATPRQHKSRPQLQQQQQGSSPERQRGRNNLAKDKSASGLRWLLLLWYRTISKPRAGHGGRGRQASPSPIPQPEQVSTDETVTISNSSKPVSSTPASTVLSAPSGKLAKRRNRASVPFPFSASTPSVAPKVAKQSAQVPPTRSKPMSVPGKSARAKMSSLPISRSDPVLSHFPRTPARRAVADAFPICDDNDDDDLIDRPSTPSPSGRKGASGTWHHSSLYNSDSEDGGPKTAPISMKEGVAKQYFPSPVPSPSHPAHKRTPSVPADSVFDLSFNSDNELNVTEMSALFGRASSHRPRYDGSVRSTSTPLRKPDPAFNKFASPMFQNSPSPEQLPPPTFSLAKMKKALVSEAN